MLRRSPRAWFRRPKALFESLCDLAARHGRLIPRRPARTHLRVLALEERVVPAISPRDGGGTLLPAALIVSPGGCDPLADPLDTGCSPNPDPGFDSYSDPNAKRADPGFDIPYDPNQRIEGRSNLFSHPPAPALAATTRSASPTARFG